MFTVKLSFVSLHPGNESYIRLFEYDIPTPVQAVLKDTLSLNAGQNVLSFGRFVDFKPDHHFPLLNYIFTELNRNVERIVVGETKDTYAVTYKLIGTLPAKFSLDDCIFMGAILHHLNMKSLLVAIVPVILKKFSVDLETFKASCKDSAFSMIMYHN